MSPAPRLTTRDEVHFVAADDGVPLTVIHVRGDVEPTKGPVLLVHGIATRAESFRPPGQRTIVDALLADGWDVWMPNWRGSIDLDPLPWTLDDVALHDHPAIVRHVLSQTGAESLAVVAHCAGSATVSMAVTSGLLPEVRTVVSNGVSLHPVVPRFTRTKLTVLSPLAHRDEPFVDIAWGDGPERGVALLTRNAVRIWHAECTNPTCNMASFALGSGHPALWLHANLTGATHRWLRNEFGKVPMSYYTQLKASAKAGQFVALAPSSRLPSRFASGSPRGDARFALFTGAHNRSFLPDSQRTTHAYLERHQPGRHSLHVLPRYSHSDMFIGTRAHAEVFPLMLAELNR